MDESVAGIAGRDENPQCRAMLPRVLAEMLSIQLTGEAQICEQEIDPCVTLEEFQCRARVAGFEHLVSEFTEAIARESAHVLVVFNDEDRFAVSGESYGAPLHVALRQ
jgi:hypothetical protein